MMTAEAFVAALRHRGFDFFTWVPCSLLADLHRVLKDTPEVHRVESVREDDAVGQAAGAYLAGCKPVVLMQNSGLGNSLNAIVSLNQIYRQPFLLIVSWRGEGGKDAPEHLVMGRAMLPILDAIEMPWQIFDGERAEEQLARVEDHFEEGRPSALVIRKGLFDRGER